MTILDPENWSGELSCTTFDLNVAPKHGGKTDWKRIVLGGRVRRRGAGLSVPANAEGVVVAVRKDSTAAVILWDNGARGFYCVGRTDSGELELLESDSWESELIVRL